MAFQIEQKQYPAPPGLDVDVPDSGAPEEEAAYSLEEILEEFGGKTASSQEETGTRTMEGIVEKTDEIVEETDEIDEDIKIWPETIPANIEMEAEESPETEEAPKDETAPETEETPEAEETPQAEETPEMEEPPAQSPETAAEAVMAMLPVLKTGPSLAT